MFSAPPRIFLWSDRFLYLGPSFDTRCHRHHAAQILVGLDGAFRLRGGSEQTWSQMQSALIDTDTPHMTDATGTDMAALYLEPESAVYAAFQQSRETKNASRLDSFSVDPALRQTLAEYRVHGAPCEQAHRASLALLKLEQEPQMPPELDPRVVAALARIRGDYEGLDELAQHLHLSPSRLAHLFREHTGVAIRRYALWSRLRRAVEYALNGASLTETAHATGFTDSAHLSNSFRQMFGLPPSFLFDKRINLDVHIC